MEQERRVNMALNECHGRSPRSGDEGGDE